MRVRCRDIQDPYHRYCKQAFFFFFTANTFLMYNNSFQCEAHGPPKGPSQASRGPSARCGIVSFYY